MEDMITPKKELKYYWAFSFILCRSKETVVSRKVLICCLLKMKRVVYY